MKTYNKSWTQKIDGNIAKQWTQFSTPMSLKINEDSQSVIFISANLAFNCGHKREMDKKHQGSLYYKILVNGEKLVEYHLMNPTYKNKTSDINIHGVSDIPPGENTIEVFYKVSNSGAWNLLESQNKRELSILSFPKCN